MLSESDNQGTTSDFILSDYWPVGATCPLYTFRFMGIIYNSATVISLLSSFSGFDRRFDAEIVFDCRFEIFEFSFQLSFEKSLNTR